MYETKPWLKCYDYNVPQTIQYPKISVPSMVHIAAAHFLTRQRPVFSARK